MNKCGHVEFLREKFNMSPFRLPGGFWMDHKVSDDLIKRQARELQGIELTDERCTELAVEVGGYNRRVSDAAADLEFDNEPAEFAKLLRGLRREPPAAGE